MLQQQFVNFLPSVNWVLAKKNFNSLTLNDEQKKSLTFIRSFGENYNVSVLEGVTGSGKTIVYFERIKDIIHQGRQALILIPEIALTNQFKTRFKDFFGSEPELLGSEDRLRSQTNGHNSQIQLDIPILKVFYSYFELFVYGNVAMVRLRAD